MKLNLVKFGENLADDILAKYPFKKGQIFVMLGELENMPGHCVIADKETGKVHVGYHIESFRVLNVEEV